MAEHDLIEAPNVSASASASGNVKANAAAVTIGGRRLT
ncbi:MAG: hypothetical protein QOF46_2994, partial [Paraburkholderia sp.]|nr:hypothetical protein [Paraburkholderia sp.]